MSAGGSGGPRDGEGKGRQIMRGGRISIPNIPVAAARWYLVVFNAITIYLAVTNTILAVSRENAAGWQAIQYIATGEILKAGGVALIAAPTVVEVGKMVLAGIWIESRERKARQEARAALQAEWEAWNQRRKDADAKGVPFDEPPPKLET